MKNVLAFIGGAFILFCVMSYRVTNGNDYRGYRTAVPLKQRGIIVTEKYSRVCTLLSKGWIVADVDFTGDGNHTDVIKHYTLILY